MRDHLRPLRIRLAIVSFLAIYIPLLVLIIVTLTAQALDENSEGFLDDGSTKVVASTSSGSWQIVLITAAVTAPMAGALSWWWSGRAVKPIAESMVIHEQLVEETSHELRTPLAILTNNAEVLLGHPDPSLDDYRAGLTRSLTTAHGMTRTIDALLVDARGRARMVVRKPTDVAELVEQTTEKFQAVADDAQVTLVCQPSTAVAAPVDAASIDRAVGNLISNAIKVSPVGSTVNVTVASLDSGVEIAVTDQGPGIPEADQSRVFDRYWQGSRSAGEGEGAGAGEGEGAGIGLDIVQQVAHAHGGDVTVESPVADERGTRFVLSLTRRTQS